MKGVCESTKISPNFAILLMYCGSVGYALFVCFLYHSFCQETLNDELIQCFWQFEKLWVEISTTAVHAAIWHKTDAIT